MWTGQIHIGAFKKRCRETKDFTKQINIIKDREEESKLYKNKNKNAAFIAVKDWKIILVHAIIDI